MIRNYLKIAWRSLWRHKAAGFINIGGLAVGMAAAVLIFMWVQNELDFDKYHNDSERVYRIKNFLAIDKTSTWIWENSPYMMGEEAKKQIPEVDNITRISPISYAPIYFIINDEFFPEEKAAYVDDQWFNVFKYEFVSGSASAFNKNPFSLVLSESKAKKYFGNTNAIGQTIKIDTTDYQVQAVIKDVPANSSFVYDILIPVAAKQANPDNKKQDMQWGNFSYITFVKLHANANTKKVAAKIGDITKKNRDADNLKIGLTPLRDLHFENDLQSSALLHGDQKTTLIFGILGAFLLLIACINYVNITTARASLRAKEVSIKKIVGAGRVALFFQFVAESVMVSIIALLLTLLLIWFSLPSFNAFTGKNFVLSLTDGNLLLLLPGTLLVAIILNSIYPALLLSSFKPLNTFRGFNILRIKDTSLRKALIVVQFSFSIFLILGVITIYKQLHFIREQNPGYKREQVMQFTLPVQKLYAISDEKQRETITGEIKQALKNESAINEVALIRTHSIQNNENMSSGSADWDGRDKDFNPAMTFFDVDADYTKIVKLDIKQGRWFLQNSANDQHNVILNETAVKELGLRKPYVGQRFLSQGDTGQVIGVVKDFHYRSMHDKIGSVIIKNSGNDGFTYLIKIRPGQEAHVLSVVGKLWKARYPADPFTYSFMDEEFSKIYHNDVKSSQLMSVFAIIAIIISCLGLFGLAAFTAEQRGKEIGIRKVLGATVSGIVALLSKDFIYLVLFALLLASPLAWWLMNKWLQNFAYRIDMQWWMFVMAGLIAILIAFVTISFQAIKAALANPVKSLRSE